MNPRILRPLSILLFLLLLLPGVYAQLGKITFDLQKDKPQKYQNKTLRSEKTGEKKFNVPRKFIQNTTSHYNYFFNANNKINQVIERARLAGKPDYTKLLPFYGYSIDNTASQKTELDSVIYKATAGILLHDLRSNWVDNLYLLIGEAYYLRKDYDSAAMTFQFINYNLYPHKKKDDDQLIVGSNENATGPNDAISVSSKEDRNIIDKAFTRPPSRNDALVWQVRTLIDLDQLGEAAGLITTLESDPNFPKRLQPPLEEANAYWFYNQGMYDSTIRHLTNSLPNSSDLQEQARREFLIAQLYEITNKQEDAAAFYEKAMHHTTDPLMDIYANLNEAKMHKSNDPAELDKSIAKLINMSRKDRFEPYRDIIFYSAGELAFLKPDTVATVSFFKKSTHYNEDNMAIKNKAFLSLAEISYKQKNYKDAYAFYDSLQLSDTTLKDVGFIKDRTKALAAVVSQINIIEREDSLQLIAAMTPADRDAYLKKLSKRLQKESGVKEIESIPGNAASNYFNSKNSSSDIFGNASGTNGQWYFYNSTIKSQGYADFKRTWGKRQNVDNWRRLASSGNSAINSNRANQLGNPDVADSISGILGQNNESQQMGYQQGTVTVFEQKDLSVDGLLANVPVTKEKLNTSNSKVSRSLFQLGKDYQDLLEDYSAAVETYETSLKRYPDSLFAGELYLNLSYCYGKLGNVEKADYYKNLLLRKYEKSKFTKMALHPESMDPSKKDPAATKRYEDIYNAFIEGDFEKAVDEKKRADSIYGNNYWSPQLLYIESVYYIKKREDSTAINVLTQIVRQYPTSPLKPKAVTMIDVLKRRKSIEAYLTNLKVERMKEDSQITVFDDPTLIRKALQQDSTRMLKLKTNTIVATPDALTLDSSKRAPAIVRNATFSIDPLTPQYVMMVLTKVDPVFSTEAKNAFVRYNRDNYYKQNIEVVKDTLDKERTLLIFSQFETADAALKYMDKLKRDSRSEISWLPAAKYSFYIISEGNLGLLKDNKKLQDYIDLLNKKYPGKF